MTPALRAGNGTLITPIAIFRRHTVATTSMHCMESMSTPESSCRISDCQLLPIRQLGVSAVVCFIEHAVVFQWRTHSDFSDGASKDRAVVYERLAVLRTIQRPA